MQKFRILRPVATGCRKQPTFRTVHAQHMVHPHVLSDEQLCNPIQLNLRQPEPGDYAQWATHYYTYTET